MAGTLSVTRQYPHFNKVKSLPPGTSQRKIAEILCVPKSTVVKLLKEEGVQPELTELNEQFLLIQNHNEKLEDEEEEEDTKLPVIAREAKNCIDLLQKFFITRLFDDTNSTDIKDFESLVFFYLPEVDTVTANCKLQIWKPKTQRASNLLVITSNDEMLPSNALDAIRRCDSIIFANIFMLLKILCSIPVSTTTSERSFSGLKRIKPNLKNSIKEDRLNGLVLLFYYRNIIITPDEVLDEITKKPRKIDLVLSLKYNILLSQLHNFDV
ncbi:HAT, C-terminal dimerisation domain [Cinara cedri]|uniref:HAT, C-terminal dimerisation domain n=1 Tax=Cinara cedri TaxID=506608 RepID=A0A5E4MEQ3_9HEMI|nr:HAT, C-terminal dimerisation domain [Cinara cedri]